MNAVGAAQRQQHNRHDAREQIKLQIEQAHQADHPGNADGHDQQRKHHPGPVAETQVEHQHQNQDHQRHQQFQVVGDEHGHVENEKGHAAEIDLQVFPRHFFGLHDRIRDLFHFERGGEMGEGFVTAVAIGKAQHNGGGLGVLADQIAHIAVFAQHVRFQGGKLRRRLRDFALFQQLAHLQTPFCAAKIHHIGQAGHIAYALHVAVSLGQFFNQLETLFGKDIVGGNQRNANGIAAKDIADLVVLPHQGIIFAQIGGKIRVQSHLHGLPAQQNGDQGNTEDHHKAVSDDKISYF